MKKAYVIAIRDELTDPAEMATYTKKVMPTLAGVGVLVAYGRQDTKEGKPADGVVVLEFENYETALAWYESPAYAEAKVHRLNGADYRLIIAEGL